MDDSLGNGKEAIRLRTTLSLGSIWSVEDSVLALNNGPTLLDQLSALHDDLALRGRLRAGLYIDEVPQASIMDA